MTSLGIEKPGAIKASQSPTIRDLEWAAGFLEGEGSFKISGNAKAALVGKTQCVTAVQVQKEPLSRLQCLFGGSIYIKFPRKDTHSLAWHWQVTGPRARGVMLTLYPLLSTRRREQIEQAMEA